MEPECVDGRPLPTPPHRGEGVASCMWHDPAPSTGPAPSTPAETRLWRLLFPLGADAHHFRKQAPIGPYVTDFACHHARLGIEVDGDSHFTGAGLRRDACLKGEGYVVLHFTNDAALSNPEGAYASILTALQETSHAR